jgi:threonine dehydrogenase-like Zn-dependent dehydrogenase
MKAIQFNVTIPRYAFGLVAEKVYPPLLWSGLSCLTMNDVPEPALPGDEWVKINTDLAGICGTDTGTIYLKTSTYYEPFSSKKFTMGHEQVGRIAEVGPGVKSFKVGDRVVVEPTLWCGPRGFKQEDYCEFCAKGHINQCLNITAGDIAPGLFIGGCADTGGSWSRQFTAHRSQLYKVPDSVSDENALLVEPFACTLHPALNHLPGDDETVLIIGAGTIGLMQLAALRALGCKANILISARYSFQKEAAEKLGASEVLIGSDLYAQIAERTGGKTLKTMLGETVFVGGVDHTFDCVGTASSLMDAVALTRANGIVVIVGVPSVVNKMDWTPIFDKELSIHAQYIYHHAENYQGRICSTYDIVLELMESGKLDIGWMLNRTYDLEDYRQALSDLADKKNNPIVKAAFRFDR